MPTTYTHDKFGKDVYKKLPEHIKAVIRKGKGVYRIGQHGPDIFFYYKPICLPQSRINKIGPQMHKEPAFGFFQKGIREFEISPSPRWHPICLDSPATLCWTVPVTGMWDDLRSRRESLMRRSRQNLTVI